MLYVLFIDGIVEGVVSRCFYSRRYGGTFVDYTEVDEDGIAIFVAGLCLESWGDRAKIECFENPYSDWREW